MELIEIMKHRRSVRKYSDRSVSDKDIELVIKAAMTSASSRGRRSWSFVIVKDRDMLLKLAESRAGGASSMLSGAQAAVVVAGDTKLSDMWIEDCSIAMTNMQLMADHIGLGSCWIQIRDRDHSETVTSDRYVRELLRIPDEYRVEAILSIGYPVSHPDAYDIDELYKKLVHEKVYNESWQ